MSWTPFLLSLERKKFSLDDIEFKIRWPANGKAKDIEGYQDENIKIGGPIIIPHIHELFNLAVKQGFPKIYTESIIDPIFKNGDRNILSNYRIIMISPILAKLYGIILEKKISIWLESHGKRAKGHAGGLRDIIQLWTILLPLGSLQRSSTILKLIFFVVLLTLEKLLTWFLGKTFGIG